MPKKIRELIKMLEKAGFVNRGGKGSHRNFVKMEKNLSVVISGNEGHDAKKYQEKQVKDVIKESQK